MKLAFLNAFGTTGEGRLDKKHISSYIFSLHAEKLSYAIFQILWVHQ